MTREQWNELIRRINAAWPSNALTPEQEVSYFDALKDLRTEQVSNAIVSAVQAGSTTPPSAEALRAAALAPSGQPFGRPAPTPSRLVVDVPRDAAPTPATPVAAPPPAGPLPRPPSSAQDFFRSRLALGIACVLAGAAVAVGLTLLLGPDADAAYVRGVSYGQQKGYAEGDSDGYDRGYDAGKDSVFGDLNGASPVSGRFYVIKYGSGDITSWFDEPLVPGICYSLRSGFSSDYQLRSTYFC
jgi:hypothetical protein